MNFAVIFAGGVGKRMHSKEIPKQFLKLHDKPIIVHTIERFESSADIDGIIISCVSDYVDYMNKLVMKFGLSKVLKVVPGGRTGQESIYNGLKVAEEFSKSNDDIVLIHDGVRPLIYSETITNNINNVKKYGSAITSVKAKETILVVDEDESVINIPDRSNVRLARAPQSFFLHDILRVHRQAIMENKFDFIDSCSMMKYYGKKVYLVDGPQENLKITTPDDFYTLRALLDAKENVQIYGLGELT